MLGVLLLIGIFGGSFLVLYNAEDIAPYVNRLDIYHVITGQPIDDDDSSQTDRCSEPSSYESDATTDDDSS